ncbi:MAG: NAD(P)H-hydrate dehydratase [Thermogladius sp.]
MACLRFFKVVSSREAREIDEKASSEYGLDSEVLMEDAGSAVYEVARREFGLDNRFLVVAGTGNNGGDALVAARRLYSAGAEVRVLVVGDLAKASTLMAKNLERLRKMGVDVTVVSSERELELLRREIEWSTVLIVGIFGLGLRGEVKDYRRGVIEAVNSSGKPVISVDIPSGVNPDNGRVEGVAVKSTVTVTFGLPKYGNVLHPGAYYSGKLYVSTLSYPPALLDSPGIKVELNYPLKIPERPRWGHKGTFGKYLLVAGSRYYYGAPYYASVSFYQTGGGYARLLAPKSVVPVLAAKASGVVYIPGDETEEGSLSLSNLKRLLKTVDEAGIDIVAVGPGLSTHRETMELVARVVGEVKVPVIVDGDGLTALSGRLDVLKSRAQPAVLTPHPGEFSRLTGLTIKEIESDPVGHVSRFASEYEVYVVLKTARSVIGFPDGRVYINLTGNPGMAKAGMGDVLVGVIAGVFGLGLRDVGLALRAGVLVHGLAGDIAAGEVGEDGVTPDLVLQALPRVVKLLRENPEAIVDRYFPIRL